MGKSFLGNFLGIALCFSIKGNGRGGGRVLPVLAGCKLIWLLERKTAAAKQLFHLYLNVNDDMITNSK